jgi:hypothetical protein
MRSPNKPMSNYLIKYKENKKLGQALVAPSVYLLLGEPWLEVTNDRRKERNQSGDES